MTNDRTLMLDLYRSLYHFIAALRCAEAVSETESEIRFVQRLRWRYIYKANRMKMTAKEWQRLTMLAIEGGWDGTGIDQLEEMSV